MPSYNQCFYKECTNTKKSHPKLSFHRFPQDLERLTVWINRIGGDAAMDENFKKWNNRMICSTHFNPLDFKDGRRPILKENANSKDFHLANSGTSSDIGNTLINENIYKSNDCYDSFPQVHKIKNDDSTVAILMKDLIRARRAIKKLYSRNLALRRRISRYHKISKKWRITQLIFAAKRVIKQLSQKIISSRNSTFKKKRLVRHKSVKRLSCYKKEIHN